MTAHQPTLTLYKQSGPSPFQSWVPWPLRGREFDGCLGLSVPLTAAEGKIFRPLPQGHTLKIQAKEIPRRKRHWDSGLGSANDPLDIVTRSHLVFELVPSVK